jgi:hypothetical protein
MAKLFIDASLVPNKLIASSLLVGLLSIISTTAIAQPSSAPSAEQSQPAPTKNTIAEQLQGQWQVKDPSSGQTLTLIFTQDGKFFMLLPLESGSGLAVPFGYRINPTPQPMHMDVLLPEDNQTVMTIFEFTPERRYACNWLGQILGNPDRRLLPLRQFYSRRLLKQRLYLRNFNFWVTLRHKEIQLLLTLRDKQIRRENLKAEITSLP